MRGTFTRLDSASPDEILILKDELSRNQPRVADRVLGMLGSLADIVDGFAVNQLVHCLQTAARAEHDGASDELLVAALCHDVGKAVSVVGHAGISAAILKPYVSPDVFWMIDNHQVFQGRHYAEVMGTDPNAYRMHEGHPCFERTMKFVDEWDQNSFDPAYPTPELARYEPLIRKWFARPIGR